MNNIHTHTGLQSRNSRNSSVVVKWPKQACNSTIIIIIYIYFFLLISFIWLNVLVKLFYYKDFLLVVVV